MAPTASGAHTAPSKTKPSRRADSADSFATPGKKGKSRTNPKQPTIPPAAPTLPEPPKSLRSAGPPNVPGRAAPSAPGRAPVTRKPAAGGILEPAAGESLEPAAGGILDLAPASGGLLAPAAGGSLAPAAGGLLASRNKSDRPPFPWTPDADPVYNSARDEEELPPGRSAPPPDGDDPDSSSSESDSEPEPAHGLAQIPALVDNFEIPRRILYDPPALFRPRDPDHRVITGRKDEITSTVLYCNCAWLERAHNLQTNTLDILESDAPVARKLELVAFHTEYTRFLLHHVKEFTAARYDTIRLQHTHGSAYAQAIEEFVSEIPSDFKSGVAARVGKSLRKAQLKNATRAQAQSAWGSYPSAGSSGQPSGGKSRKKK